MARLRIYAVAVSVLAGTAACTELVACRNAPSRLLTVVPSEMRSSGPRTKEPDGGIAFWGSGALETQVDLTGGIVKIIVSAKGNFANGEWPKVHITLENQIIAAVTADSRSMQEYTIYAQVPRFGSNLLRVEFVNFSPAPGGPLASRNLTIGKIVLRQP